MKEGILPYLKMRVSDGKGIRPKNFASTNFEGFTLTTTFLCLHSTVEVEMTMMMMMMV